MFKETIIEFVNRSIDLKPLQYLAALRLVMSVCETEDMQYMIGRLQNVGSVGFSDDQWSLLRGNAKSKLKQIFLSDIIIDIVLENLWPISFEICRWIIYHVDTGIDGSPKFYWTPQFNIDYVKTAKTLVKNDALDINKRYKMACFYCLDSDVRCLWEQMSLSERKSFLIPGNVKKSNHDPILHYWTYYMQELPIDDWDCTSPNYSELFYSAVHKGCLSATKYFLGKLKGFMQMRMIEKCLNWHLYNKPHFYAKYQSAIACYFLCQLPSDDVITRFFYKLNLIFLYFLEWPLQKYFMTVVHRLKGYLHEGTFVVVLEGIFDKLIGDFQDYDYKGLFVEFWHECPEESKPYVRTQKTGYKILMQFVKKHFGFVFEENSFDIKEKFRAIVFQQEISENVTYFEKENVEFFKFLVRENVTTISTIYSFSLSFNENILYNADIFEFRNLPIEELVYLIDGIWGIV